MPRGPTVKESGMVRNSIYNQIYFSLVAYAACVLPYVHDYVHIDVTRKEIQTSVWTQHKYKGKKGITFLLVPRDMTVFSEKNKYQSLQETRFPSTLSNNTATSVKGKFL